MAGSTPESEAAEITRASAQSPCVQICEIAEGVCVGCGRTLEEIGAWGSLNDWSKKRVNARLAREFW